MPRYNFIFLCAALWMLPCFATAQGQNNMWTFGHNNGLNFNTNPPAFFQNSNLSTEGCASVADSLGNLLFYSNGNTVWNASGAAMPNGNGILGNGPDGNGLPASCAQGVAIIQLPANHRQYYLFTLDAAEDINAAYTGYLRYSLIDMTLNGGTGDVVAGQKNILLDDHMSEKMTVAKGAGCYYWLLTHKNNAPAYRAFKIDVNGIQPGISSNGSWQGDVGAGQLKISPDGTKIATCNSMPNTGVEIGSFDNATGIISNTSLIDLTSNSGIGTCFSPDNSKLYIGTIGNLAQYDMSAYPNFAAIETSKIVLAAGLSFSNLRNGPDGKIYIAFYSNHPFIGVINNPNAAGLAANVVTNALPQPAWAAFTGDIYGHGLGNDNVYGLLPDITINDPQEINGCDNSIALSAPQGFAEYHWNDGITTQSRNAATAGTYWVSSANACTIFIDTFKVSLIELAVDLGPDTAICNRDNLLLNAAYPGATYRWQDGSTDPTLLADNEGIYTVKISKQGCDQSDTITITYLDPFANIVERDTTICKGDKMILHTESYPISTYNWNTGGTNASISIQESGVYSVIANNVCGAFADSISINTQDCDCLAFIPNSFTPNDDHTNDIYKIEPRCAVTNFSMSIYNRFGERIFQTQSPDMGWDGRYKEQLCDVGSYFFYIHFRGPRGNEIVRKGDVLLLR